MACVSSLEPHCCWLDQALALVPEPQAVPGCPCPAVSSRSEPREVHTAAWGVTAAVHHLISPPTAWWAVPAERQLLKQAAVVAAQKLSACKGPRQAARNCSSHAPRLRLPCYATHPIDPEAHTWEGPATVAAVGRAWTWVLAATTLTSSMPSDCCRPSCCAASVSAGVTARPRTCPKAASGEVAWRETPALPTLAPQQALTGLA